VDQTYKDNIFPHVQEPLTWAIAKCKPQSQTRTTQDITASSPHPMFDTTPSCLAQLPKQNHNLMRPISTCAVLVMDPSRFCHGQTWRAAARTTTIIACQLPPLPALEAAGPTAHTHAAQAPGTCTAAHHGMPLSQHSRCLDPRSCRCCSPNLGRFNLPHSVRDP
jgi:hypothetical protein